MSDAKIIAVVGATGRQGGAVAERLLASGARVRALTRRPHAAGARRLAQLGAELVQADLENRRSLDAALRGASAVFGVTEFWEHGRRAEQQQGIDLVDAALDAGVERFVFSSVGGVDRTRELGIAHFDSKRAIEEHLVASGMAWSILRPVTFFENFVSARYRRAIRAGSFRFAIEPELPFQLVAMDDIAFFAQLALDGDPRLDRRAVEIAGDRLTMRELSAVLSEAVGRTVRYRKLSRPELWALAGFVELTRTTGHFKTGWALLRMFDWMNASPTGGWDADLTRLRRQHPALMGAREWAAKVDWSER